MQICAPNLGQGFGFIWKKETNIWKKTYFRLKRLGINVRYSGLAISNS